ncbi:MAG: T9SS type A sorting domain-containing protein [Xanthomarina gelatinilytica]|uniref:T9SS type A sorting domain-containing protein n=1 Tax=Xanthomarina gelatinilytica TaxID=1137281 RepID=UPI003A88CB18
MKKTLLTLLLLVSAYIGYSQCDPVTSIDEDFNGWTEIDECWSTITAGALVYTEVDAITCYSLFAPNTPTMLVTPEIVADTYTLAFDASVITGSSTSTGLQIQVGTVTDTNDAGTFTAIGDPFDMTTTQTTYAIDVTLASGEYLAFNAILPQAHAALTLDNVMLTEKCPAVSSIDENFNGWTEIDECWSTITTGALVYQDADAITCYSLFSPNTPTMLVTPEIVADTYTLEFDAGVIAGSSTSTGLQIQVGTVTDTSNPASFTAIGSAFDITSTMTTFTIEVTLASGEYLAFNAILPQAHAALSLDNIVINSSSLSIDDSEINEVSFKVYPNPSTNGIVNLAYDDNRLNSNNNSVSVYSITGIKVFETKLNTNNAFYNKSLDLSNLSSGTYLLQFNSGSYTTTKKLILK